jgi:succinyl-diaminopimelate desuccinylase
VKTFQRAPALVSRANPYVRALREAVSNSLEGEALSIGRDGASDAISFLEAGVPAVEFGPVGGGHHGPAEWVSIDSLQRYRRALGDFVTGLPTWLAAAAVEGGTPLHVVDGGRA